MTPAAWIGTISVCLVWGLFSLVLYEPACRAADLDWWDRMVGRANRG